ncbi:MAG TPA: OmpH family outer membrane protein [Nitrospira sp.]|jgi:outer membrane protein|nr:OmpH family outer membrane protein [Nitrospira sp.]
MPTAKTRWGQIAVAVTVMGAWLMLIAASGALAADAFKMGVIDPQMVLEKSKAGKKALDGLKEYVSTRQKLLSRDEEELRNTEKTLKESKLSEGEKKEKEAQFRGKIQEYQKRAQEFNQELQGKQKELVDEYMKRIASATQTVAEKGGFSIVVDKGSEQTIKIVIYSKEAIDLTDQVIKEFDRVNSK